MLLKDTCHAHDAKVQDCRETAAEHVTRRGDALVDTESEARPNIQRTHLMLRHAGERGDAHIADRDSLGMPAYA